MIKVLRFSLMALCACFILAALAYAQSSDHSLNITLGEQRVKFMPTRSFQEMRLEVLNQVGEIVFSHTTVEAEFDWNLRSGNGDALAPGLYTYRLALKFSEDQTRQHTGHFIIEKSQDQLWLTAQDGADVSGAALNAARSSGRSIAGLTTADGKSVKRDASGREILDEKGNKLPGDKDGKNGNKSAKQEKSALLGTVNRVAKFAADGTTLVDSAVIEVGGNVGIGTTSPNAKLSVSNNTGAPPTETGIVGYFVNANEQNTFMTADSYGNGNWHSDFLFRRARGTMAAPLAVQTDDIVGQIQMRGYGATGFSTTARAGIRLTAAENWSDAAQGAYLAFMTTPKLSNTINVERMRLTEAGNLGLGVTAPAAKLEVGGDIRSSALRQELIANAPPNIINGFMGTGSGGATPGNRVTAGVVGASIGGGGFNGAIYLDDGSSPSGGDNSNRVTDLFGTVGGGFKNRAGSDNADKYDARFATVSGGWHNTASGDFATVGGGTGNTASVLSATVGGGAGNTASVLSATVGGGYQNTASGVAATVGGGESNTASGSRSVVPGGERATATHYGEMAFASGRFSADGDAQTSVYTLRRVTSNATPTELFLDNLSQRITLASDRAVSFDILVTANTAAGQVAGYQIRGVIKNIGGTTTFVGAPVVTILGEDNAAWNVFVDDDNTNDALVIRVAGAAATTIRWLAAVRTAELSF